MEEGRVVAVFQGHLLTQSVEMAWVQSSSAIQPEEASAQAIFQIGTTFSVAGGEDSARKLNRSSSVFR